MAELTGVSSNFRPSAFFLCIAIL